MWHKRLIVLVFLMFAAPLAQADTVAECVFKWAERSYPELFAADGAYTSVIGNTLYRYYPSTRPSVSKLYVDISSNANHVYYSAGSSALDVGPLSVWVNPAGCSAASTTGGTTGYAGNWVTSQGKSFTVGSDGTVTGLSVSASVSGSCSDPYGFVTKGSSSVTNAFEPISISAGAFTKSWSDTSRSWGITYTSSLSVTGSFTSNSSLNISYTATDGWSGRSSLGASACSYKGSGAVTATRQ